MLSIEDLAYAPLRFSIFTGRALFDTFSASAMVSDSLIDCFKYVYHQEMLFLESIPPGNVSTFMVVS
jgi:hypothetical protein